MRELGDSLGVNDYYKWIGPLRGSEKHAAFESCEFLALPSDEDPYPLALLEAMAHRKPILTTDVVGQAADIRANNAGVLVAPGDLDAIVNAAGGLLADPEYRTAIAANGRRLAEEIFSVQAMVDEIEGLYRSVIDGKRVPAPRVE